MRAATWASYPVGTSILLARLKTDQLLRRPPGRSPVLCTATVARAQQPGSPLLPERYTDSSQPCRCSFPQLLQRVGDGCLKLVEAGCFRGDGAVH